MKYIVAILITLAILLHTNTIFAGSFGDAYSGAIALGNGFQTAPANNNQDDFDVTSNMPITVLDNKGGLHLIQPLGGSNYLILH